MKAPGGEPRPSVDTLQVDVETMPEPADVLYVAASSALRGAADVSYVESVVVGDACDVEEDESPVAFAEVVGSSFAVKRDRMYSRETLNPLEAAALAAAGQNPDAGLDVAQLAQQTQVYEGDGGDDGAAQEFAARCGEAVKSTLRGCRQLGVVLKKNAIIAARRPCQTSCVILMPLCFVLVLLIGVVLVKDSSEPSITYVNRTFDLAQTLNVLTDFASGRAPDSVASGDIVPDASTSVSSDAILELSELVYSPLPVLPLDGYIALQRVIEQTVNPSALTAIKQANTNGVIGGILGNLLEGGTLHFAIAEPDPVKYAMAERLVGHINATSVFFDSVYYGRVWERESDALVHIEAQSGVGRKTFGLVVVDQISDDPPEISYRLRMNYSYIPSTKTIVNRFSVRLDSGYIRYWSSGFLSIQQAVDSWGFRADIDDERKRAAAATDQAQSTLNSLVAAAIDPASVGVNISSLDADLRSVGRLLAEQIENATLAANAVLANRTLNGTNATRAFFTFNDVAAAVARGIQAVPQDQLGNETAVASAIVTSVTAIGVSDDIARTLATNVADDIARATRDLQAFVGPAVGNALNSSGALNTTLGRQLMGLLEQEAAVVVAGQVVSTLLVAQTEQNVTLGDIHSLFRDELIDADLYNTTAAARQSPVTGAAEALWASIVGGKDTVWASPMPTPSYLINRFLQVAGFLIGQLTVMATLYPFGVLVKGLVEEKEMELRELMKIAGLQPWVNSAGWIITYWLLFALSALIVTTYLIGALFTRTSFTLLYAHLLMFYTANVALALVLATFFSRARLASILSPVILFVFLCPRYIFYAPGIEDTDLVWARYLSALLRCAVGLSVASHAATVRLLRRYTHWTASFPAHPFARSLHPPPYAQWHGTPFSPTAFAMGTDTFGLYEGANMGMQWADIATKSGPLPEFTVLSSFLMMAFDTVLYLFLAWYFDNVLPSAFGTPKPAWFCVTPGWCCPRWADKRSFRCCIACVEDEAQIDDDNEHGPAPSVAPVHLRRRHMRFVTLWTLRDEDAAAERDAAGDESDQATRSNDGRFVQALTPELLAQAPVQLQGLRKVYGRAFGCRTEPKVAVHGLDLNLIEGSITCLLGHNGAGKSTTIKMMCGLTPASEGDMRVYGRSARFSMQSVRQTSGIGWCPQHSRLFPHLTVGEHVELFAAIKGVPCGQVERDVVAMLRDVGLFHKRRTLSGKLSGGMKRRLSVAIALIGNSKLVMLDEPTSGVDPVSRRDMWKLLRKHKKGRVMVLTTHYMDEAELLADRVAVLSKGVLKCYGTTQFIKSIYTVGYSLTVSKSSAAQRAAASGGGGGAAVAAAQHGAQHDAISNEIMQLVRRHVPNARLVSDAASELGFHLPHSASPAFSDLFLEIERNAVGSAAGGGGRAPIIDTFGLAMTNLESVFMMICDGEHKEELRQRGINAINDAAAGVEVPTRIGALLRSIGLVDILGPVLRRLGVALIVGDGTCTEEAAVGADVAEGSGTGALYVDAEVMLEDGAAALPVLDEMSDPWTAHRTENACARCTLRWEGLFLKRIYNFRRDVKLIFCQLCVIPLSVALVFAILTIRNNDAGPMIHLNTALYDNAVQMEQQVLFSDLPRHVPYLPADALTHGIAVEANTSLAMSDVLLEEAYAHGSSGRWLAAVANDTFAFNAPVLDVQRLIDGASTGGVSLTLLQRIVLATVSTQNPAALAGVVLQLVAANPALAQEIRFETAPEGSPTVPLNVQQTVLFNATARHAWPCMLSDLTEAESGHRITVKSHPLPMTEFQTKSRSSRLAFTAAWLLMIPFSLLPALYAAFIVQERSLQSKHQQFLSGAEPISFWLTSYIWDALNNCVVVAISLGVILCYQPDTYVGTFERFTCLALILFLYGLSSIALTYLYSNFFTNHSTAQVVITLVNFVTGFVLIMTHYSLLVNEETRPTDEFLVHIFRIFPSFCMGEAILNMGLAALLSGVAFLGLKTPQPFDWDVTGRDLTIMAAETVIYLLLVVVVEIASGSAVVRKVMLWAKTWLRRVNFFPALQRAWTAAVDKVYGVVCAPVKRALRRVLPCCLVDDAEDEHAARIVVINANVTGAGGNALELQTPGAGGVGGASSDRGGAGAGTAPASAQLEDAEVTKERERIERGDAEFDALLMSKLRKEFPSAAHIGTHFTAVNDVSLGVPKSQCFGLLGANGAGKTTSLSMVTGKLDVTSGSVTVGGISAAAARQDQRIGYCPQIDPLLPNMTCYETIAFYARLKGIPREHLRATVDRAVVALGIGQYANVRASALSGGNMRKLSLGCAMIGGPGLLLLDEPSSGLDPAARRSMWRIVDGVRGDGTGAKRSIVLTTHSMEECEALCSRIGIMVLGTLRCLGSATRLKATYGQGWHIEINVARVGENWISTSKRASSAAAAEQLEGGAMPLRPPTPRSELPVPEAVFGMPLADRIARVHDFMVAEFVGAECEEEFDGRLQYHVPIVSVKHLSTLFATLERHKARLAISTYSVSQATLEQVFCLIVNRHTTA